MTKPFHTTFHTKGTEGNVTVKMRSKSSQNLANWFSASEGRMLALQSSVLELASWSIKRSTNLALYIAALRIQR